MQKKFKLILLLALLVVGIKASADEGGFYYENVRFQAVVHKNNVWDVKETFTLNFLEPRHGFYRFIPCRYSIYHDVSQESDASDVKRFFYYPKISDVKVTGGSIHDQFEENDNWVVQIGDANTTVTGFQTYEISYTFTYPDDRLDTKDYVFHTILGADFNEDIKHFEFDIQLDKALSQRDLDNLQWYSGEWGDTLNIVPIEYDCDQRHIWGECDSVMPNHAITIYMPLQEGYFEGVEKASNSWHYIWLTLTAICLLVIVVRAFTLKRGKPVKSIEFYPPDDISSAEVGVIIDETVDDEDIASLITWFAHKGYLKITEIEKHKLSLTKLRNLPSDAPQYQQKFMHLLFSGSSSVCLDEIGEKPEEMQGVKNALENCFSDDGSRKLTDTDWGFVMYFVLLLFGTFAITTNTLCDFDFDEFYVSGFIWVLPFGLCFAWRFIDCTRRWTSSAISRWIGIIGRFVIMAIAAIIYALMVEENGGPMTIEIILAFYLVHFFVIELQDRFTIDTSYRIDMMGKLLGFKEFIETAEKPQLENLQMEDAQYFYRVLPYAMVFGLANKWSKKFKDIQIDRPDWYDGSTGLTGYYFTQSLVSNVNNSVRDSVASISHDSSSSSSSGGGFSGGGGGGGGGGSW